MIGIYTITNEVNHERYIGSSFDIESRWETHRYDLERNQHANSRLQNAWNKYGSSMFRFGVQEDVGEQFEFPISRDILLEIEQWYLDNYRSTYNLNKFADAPPNAYGRIKSRESIDRQIESRRQNGRPWVSEETRQKIRVARIQQENNNTSGFAKGWELNQLKKLTRVQLVCERCSILFELPPSQARGRRFCSASCQHSREAPTS